MSASALTSANFGFRTARVSRPKVWTVPLRKPVAPYKNSRSRSRKFLVLTKIIQFNFSGNSLVWFAVIHPNYQSLCHIKEAWIAFEQLFRNGDFPAEIFSIIRRNQRTEDAGCRRENIFEKQVVRFFRSLLFSVWQVAVKNTLSCASNASEIRSWTCKSARNFKIGGFSSDSKLRKSLFVCHLTPFSRHYLSREFFFRLKLLTNLYLRRQAFW